MAKDVVREAPETLLKITCGEAYDDLVQEQELKRALVRIPFPTFYFCAFVAMIFQHLPTKQLYAQAHSVASTLDSSGSDTVTSDSTMKFENIGGISDVFDWILNTFIPSVFITTDYNDDPLKQDKWGRIAMFNKVLGAVTFTTTRAAIHPCQTQEFLQALYPTCYDATNVETESQLFGFDKNVTESTAKMNMLKARGDWLDFATQKLEITVVTYNGEMQGYAVTKMNIDFNQGGYVDLSSSTTPILSDPYQKTSPLVLDIIVAVSFVIVLIKEVRKLFKHRGDRTYLFSLWTFIEFASLSVVVAYYIIWAEMVTMMYAPTFRNNLASLVVHGQDFSSGSANHSKLEAVTGSLDAIAKLAIALRLLAMTAVFLLGMRIIRRFRFHPRLNILMRTISRSLHQFAAFFIVFIVIFMTFAVSGTVLFGDQVKTFSSLDRAMESCINMLFGNFDYTTIQSLYAPVATLYYWAYMIVVSLILLNMMLAIVLDAYADVTSEAMSESFGGSLRRTLKGIMWDLRHHQWRSLMCGDRPLPRAKRLGTEPRRREWKHGGVVVGGRIKPSVLRLVLKEELEDEAKRGDTLTVASIQALFPSAGVTESEAVATLQHLVAGLERQQTDAKTDAKMETKLETKSVTPITSPALGLLRAAAPAVYPEEQAVVKQDDADKNSPTIPVPFTADETLTAATAPAAATTEDTKRELRQLQAKIESLDQKLETLLNLLASSRVEP